eukprot:14949849-Heterocapsa_arctica.AAC.1
MLPAALMTCICLHTCLPSLTQSVARAASFLQREHAALHGYEPEWVLLPSKSHNDSGRGPWNGLAS